MNDPHPLYLEVAETIRLLHSEGFIELEDYSSILQENQAILQRMLDQDLHTPAQWLTPLLSSIELWRTFTEKAGYLITEASSLDRLEQIKPGLPSPEEISDLQHTYWGVEDIAAPHTILLDEDTRMFMHAWPEKKPPSLHDVLRSYLSYVNANIIISNQLNVGFHDWADFLPFYKHKFLYVGQEVPEPEKEIQAIHRLFDLSFPEFEIAAPADLIKILRDRRLIELRQLVEEAVEGKVVFDAQFARRILREVLQTERKINRYRNIISYLTLPIDLLNFLPGVGGLVQKGVEELAGFAIERRLQKHRWFYLLSDISEAPE
jgi:hypothetical protein